MLYSLKAVRADQGQRPGRQRQTGSFWARYALVLRMTSAQPGTFGYAPVDGER